MLTGLDDGRDIIALTFMQYLLQERGYMYTSKHEGWYSVSDETFFPKSAIQLVLDPRTGRKMMVHILPFCING
jgi:methionyl-tRNA synthetase